MNKLSSLSIFFPAFNEEKNIPLAIDQALEIAPEIATKFEIIVVNDGSSDKTKEVVEEISKKVPQVRLVNHPTNLGYGAALKTGFYNSKLDYITYMDADLQFDFAEVKKLIEKIDQADIVVGYRIKRADNFLRTLNGVLWTFLVGTVLGVKIRDIDCGFKLLKKQVIDTIPKLESNGATISGELLYKAQKNGFKIVEVGLIHKPRKFGQATGGNLLHILRAFKDLVLITR